MDRIDREEFFWKKAEIFSFNPGSKGDKPSPSGSATQNPSKDNLRVLAKSVYDHLKKQVGFAKLMKERQDDSEESCLDELIRNNPQEAEREKEILEKLKAEYDALSVKITELSSEAETVLFMAADRKMNVPGVDAEELIPAVKEFYCMRKEQTDALKAARTCILSYLRYLLTGEMCELQVANYVRECYGLQIHARDIFEPIDEIKNYVPFYRTKAEQIDPLSTLEEFRDCADYLNNYKDEHPDLFGVLLPAAVIFADESLVVMAERARSLRDGIFCYITEVMTAVIPQKEADELSAMWIQAESMYQMALMIMEFVEANHEKAMIDLTDSSQTELYEMEYRNCERAASRKLTVILKDLSDRLKELK